MKRFKAKLLGLSLLVVALSACNRGFDKVVPPGIGEDTTATVFKKPKVLYIIVDGARGTVVRDANVPTLKSLLPHAIYTWNSLADATQATNATNWADMITGVRKEKHNVLTEDFAGNNLATYKTIFERIKSINANTRIASFASSTAFKENLTAGTNVSEYLPNDEQVKTRMVDFVKTDASDLIVGQFSGVQAAGIAGGTDGFNSDGYKAAINTFDTQLGAILESVRSRTTFKAENWLIIVSSNKGGPFTLGPTEDDKTVFSNTNANTFTIVYNSSYNPTFIAKPFVGTSYVGAGVKFKGWPEKGVATVSRELSPTFNFGDTSSFTISVKVKKRMNPYNRSRGDYYYNWPSFIGKQGANMSDANPSPAVGWAGSQTRGWHICFIRNAWRVMLVGTKGSNTGSNQEIVGGNVSGDTWHDLTMVVERTVTGGKQLRMYLDGVPGVSNRNGGSITSLATTPVVLPNDVNFDNNSVLRMGWATGEIDGGESANSLGQINVDIKEVKIFKAALSDAVVRQYACDQSIDRSHPFFSSLIGYWKVNEGSGTVIRDQVGRADFTLAQSQTGGYVWTPFTDLLCSPDATNLSLTVPKNSDIPAQILSWFNIARQTSWSLDGKVWIAN
jgi:hypothetical protein